MKVNVYLRRCARNDNSNGAAMGADYILDRPRSCFCSYSQCFKRRQVARIQGLSQGKEGYLATAQNDQRLTA